MIKKPGIGKSLALLIEPSSSADYLFGPGLFENLITKEGRKVRDGGEKKETAPQRCPPAETLVAHLPRMEPEPRDGAWVAACDSQSGRSPTLSEKRIKVSERYRMWSG